jgi:hypothetical protein
MFEIAHDFERAAASFSPIVSVPLGLAAVAVGLFVWLGGLGFRKFLVATVGALAGAIVGSFLACRNLISAAATAVVVAVLAVVFEHVVITLLTAGLAAVCCFAVLAQIYNLDLSEGFGNACLQMPAYCWPLIAVVVVIFIAAGSCLWRLTSALCCAVFGTLLIFAGMTLLLSYKGAAPVSFISSRTSYFAVVFIAMTAFGTLEQLLFCKPAYAQPKTKKRKADSGDEPDTAFAGWRNK